MPVRLPLLARLLALAIALSACVEQAPPVSAHDVFEAGARQLQMHYYGPSKVSIPGATRDARRDLRVRCNGKPTACDALIGYLVLSNLAAALGDAHTTVFTPEAWRNRQRQALLESEPVPTYGVSVHAIDPRRALVLDVEPGAPADDAGLQPGDRLTHLDETDGTDTGMTVGRAELFGDPPVVSLMVERGPVGRATRFEVTLTREELPRRQEPVLYAPPDAPPSVRVLRIPSFHGYKRIAMRVHALVRQAQREGATGLIVDLRGGIGGNAIECLVSAGAFLGPVTMTPDTPDGLYVREWTGRWVRFDEPPARRTPLWTKIKSGPYVVLYPARWTGGTVVLVDDSTASCHERMTFQLQRAGILVLGVPTYGVHDTGSGWHPLPGGGGMLLTDSKALDAQGRPVPARVTPNVRMVNDPRAFFFSGEDAMLKAAYQQLDKQSRRGAAR